MKQNRLFILIGVSALLIAFFILGSMFYKHSETAKVADSAPPSAQMPDLQARYLGTADRTQGSKAARIALVEFLDPQCESCRRMHPITKKILAEFPGQIFYVVRYLPFHSHSVYAISLLEAAAEQGKFWEALERTFSAQERWGNAERPQPELLLSELTAMGLDPKRLERDMNNPAVQKRIDLDRADAAALGVTGTPTFFVNGQMLSTLGEDRLRALIREQIETP